LTDHRSKHLGLPGCFFKELPVILRKIDEMCGDLWYNTKKSCDHFQVPNQGV